MSYIILAIILFSFNNVLWKKNLTSISVGLLMTYRSFFTSILAVSFLFYFHDLTEFSFIQISRTFTAAILGVIGLFSMLTIYKKASLQWVAVYNLLGISFTILYLWLFKELDIKTSLIGISVVAMGFVFYVFTNKNNTLKINLKQHLLLILMTVCFGTATILNWENLNQEIPAIFIIANQEVLVFICGIILLFSQKKLNQPLQLVPTLQKYFYRVLLMSIVILLGLLFSFLGLEITNPIISSILFLANPLTTILFSAYFFNEKIKITDWIAIGVIAFGAFLLHLQTT
jgi:drug/metabolite transporter (DMT)-like permease